MFKKQKSGMPRKFSLKRLGVAVGELVGPQVVIATKGLPTDLTVKILLTLETVFPCMTINYQSFLQKKFYF